MRKRVVVVDGMGGGVGAQLVERIRSALKDEVEILALGTNSGATERMLRAGADRGASGENAIRISAGSGRLIVGPIGIVIPNGMLGEVTPAMAEALLAAPCGRVLVPVQQEHFAIAGLEQKPLGRLLDEAIELVKAALAAVE